MSGLLIKIWAIDAFQSLGVAFMIIGVGMVVLSTLIFLITLDEDEDCRKSVQGGIKKFITYGAILVLAAAIMPSKETAKILKIGFCAEYAINILKTSEALGKVSENLSDSIVELSDLIKLQCSDWKKELENEANEERK